MRVRFDVMTEEVHEHSAMARDAVSSIEPKILGIAERAAEQERQTHAYQNRTGNLEASTVGQWAGESGDLYAVELRMGDYDAPYASFVVDRGYSNFHRIAERAGKAIASAVDRVSRKVGGR